MATPFDPLLFPASFTAAQRLFELQGDDPLPQLLVHTWSLREALNRCWQMHLSVLSPDAGIEPSTLLGLRVGVLTRLADGVSEHLRTGVVLDADSSGGDGGLGRYSLQIGPWLALLNYGLRSAVWQERSVEQIIASVFARYSAQAAWTWSPCALAHLADNIELRGMLEKSQAVSPDPVNEVIDLVQDLIQRGIPAGYYDMGWYLAHGYGVQAAQELAFKYYRKSADLGNPQGQFLVGDKLSDERKNGSDIAQIGWDMYRCAADQMHANAANMLGVYLKSNGHGNEAMKYLQIAAMEGMSVGASRMASAFSDRYHGDPIRGLGQAVDPERERRYKSIADFLGRYDYLNARIPEINDIVPLPPTKLPPWNGKFNWLEEHEANVPPPLPPEERIAEMARAKGLDPKTGRPMNKVK